MNLPLHHRDYRTMTPILALLIAGCAQTVAPREPTASVPAAAETKAVATANADAADDPAIWAAAAGRTAKIGGREVEGFIAGTDKKAGLYLYALDGSELQFLPEGLLNNVDLREAEIGGTRKVVLGASDRGRMGIALYLFDPASADPANKVRPWGLVGSDVVEPYGFCMGLQGGQLVALLLGKDGQARLYRIEEQGDAPKATELRRFAVGSQSEGCTIDDTLGVAYVGQEAKGVWRYPLGGGERTLVQGVDGTGLLVADVEGTTLIRDSGRTYLLVSSQGDSAFAVWRVDGASPEYAGRFSVAAAGGVDAVTGTDGIDAHSGPIGAYLEGLVVVQDDVNDGLPQNFKLVDWREVKRVLGL